MVVVARGEAAGWLHDVTTASNRELREKLIEFMRPKIVMTRAKILIRTEQLETSTTDTYQSLTERYFANSKITISKCRRNVNEATAPAHPAHLSESACLRMKCRGG